VRPALRIATVNSFDQNYDAPVLDQVNAGPERRQHKRYQVDFYLRVVEKATNKVIGQVLDVSAGGIMISSPKPIQAYRLVHCTLEASLESGAVINVAAQCLSVWCRQDEFGSGYTAGLKFVIVDKAPLEVLIDKLS
jgi:PilZ domain